jgi:acyl dehydratase
MPLNRSLVGRVYPGSAEFEVSREVIRRFVEATGDSNPLYLDPGAARAAGHVDVVAPPTFLTVLTHRFHDEGPAVDPELGLDYSVVVHGEQRFVHHRAVVAGDRLTITVTIDDVRPAGANELVATTTRVIDAAGAPVADVGTTFVSRGTAAGETDPAS